MSIIAGQTSAGSEDLIPPGANLWSDTFDRRVTPTWQLLVVGIP